MDINSITISGTVTRTPVARTTNTGKNIAKFSIQVEKSFSIKSFFIDVDVWGKESEAVLQNLRQGEKVVIHGKLDVQVYTDNQTQQRKTATTITADSVMTLAQLQQQLQPQQYPQSQTQGYTRVQGQYQRQYAPQQQQKPQYQNGNHGYVPQPNSWTNAQPVNPLPENPFPSQNKQGNENPQNNASSSANEAVPQAPNADIPF